MVNDLLKYKRLDGTEAALRQFASFLREEDRSAPAALAGVTSPVHVLWGAEDRIVRPLTASELSPSIRLTLLEGTGHMPHLEKSAKVVEALETWMNSEKTDAHDTTSK
jgi:pyruvate dehydrogenase E2 component (dihydrolipoamide acetyltransferase)